jgi:hypothetical protein
VNPQHLLERVGHRKLERIPVGSVAKDPSSYTGRMIQVSGILRAVKKDNFLWDIYDWSKFAWLALDADWEKRSPKSVIKELIAGLGNVFG